MDHTIVERGYEPVHFLNYFFLHISTKNCEKKVSF